MIKIGIVGTGYEIGIAQMHIMAYKAMPSVTISAVYDNQKGRAQEYIKRLGLAEASDCESFEQLLEKVDAVSICTPNASHVALANKAIDAGKHVLCEKPFAPNAQQCEALVKKAAKSGLVCMIGLCYRGIPAYRYLKQLVSSGELGQIRYIRSSMGGGRIASPGVKLEWRMQKELSGSGSAADFGSHMLDTADWLLQGAGGPLSQVFCMEGSYITKRVRQDNGEMGDVNNDDVAMFTARAKGGALCSFTASRVGCVHTVEVLGDKGMAFFNGEDVFSLGLIKANEQGMINGSPQKMPVPKELCANGENTSMPSFAINFYHEITEFLHAIEKGGEVETDFARGLYVQRLIDAVQCSADEGRPVKINF